MREYKNFKKQLLKNKAIKKTYDELGPEFALIEMIIERRLKFLHRLANALEVDLKISFS